MRALLLEEHGEEVLSCPHSSFIRVYDEGIFVHLEKTPVCKRRPKQHPSSIACNVEPAVYLFIMVVFGIPL